MTNQSQTKKINLDCNHTITNNIQEIDSIFTVTC